MAKQKPAMTLVPPSKLAQINADIETLGLATSKLREADAELRKEEIALTDGGRMSFRSPAAADDLNAAALALLDGQPGQPPAKSRSARVAEITTERRKIAKALEIAEHRTTRLIFERVSEQRELSLPAWRTLQRERAMAVATLRRLNRESQKMLAPLINPNGTVSGLPASFSDRPSATFLLGTGAMSGTEADTFLKACIEAGIIRKSELDQA